MDRFKNQSVLVTGAAGGIGAAAARAFAAEGAAVTIGDIDERATETVAQIQSSGGTAQFRRTDVSDPRQVEELVAAAVGAYGRLDVAFNNAGVLPPTKSLVDVTQHEFDLIMAVDVKGVFNALQSEIRYMAAHGGGAIINTASVAGVIADPNMSPYVAAKHAVVGLTKAAGIEYIRSGIRVNAIAPGLVRSAMTERWLSDPVFTREFLASSPIGRAAEPEEMVGMVLHLASPEASFTNSQVFILDGGQTAH